MGVVCNGLFAARPADRLMVTDDRVQDLAFDGAARHLAVAREDGTVHVLIAKTGEEVQRVPGPHPVPRIAFSPDDGKLLGIGERFRAWPASGGLERHRRDLGAKVRTAFFAAEGRWLIAVTGDGRLRVLDPDGLGEERATVLGRTPVTAVSADGRWLAGIGSEAFVVMDTRTLEPVEHGLPAPGRGYPTLIFDPASRYLVATARAFAGVLDPDTSTWIDLLPRGERGTAGWSAWLGRDGKWLALTKRNEIRPVRTGTWQVFPPLTEGALVAISPDETLACTHTGARRGTRSSMLHVWRLESGDRIAWGPEPDGVRVHGAADERGGDTALVEACASWPRLERLERGRTGVRESGRWRVEVDEQIVKLHALTREDRIAQACARVLRNLTAEEWARYLPAETYRATCPDRPVPEAVRSP